VLNQVSAQTTNSISNVTENGYWQPISREEAYADYPNEPENAELDYLCNKKPLSELIRQARLLGADKPEQMWEVITKVICGKGNINLKKLSDYIQLPFDYYGSERVKGFPQKEDETIGTYTEAKIKDRAVLYKVKIPYGNNPSVELYVGELKKGHISVSVHAEAGSEYEFKLISDKWYWAGYRQRYAD
jgi:hypothetical protein